MRYSVAAVCGVCVYACVTTVIICSLEIMRRVLRADPLWSIAKPNGTNWMRASPSTHYIRTPASKFHLCDLNWIHRRNRFAHKIITFTGSADAVYLLISIGRTKNEFGKNKIVTTKATHGEIAALKMWFQIQVHGSLWNVLSQFTHHKNEKERSTDVHVNTIYHRFWCVRCA